MVRATAINRIRHQWVFPFPGSSEICPAVRGWCRGLRHVDHPYPSLASAPARGSPPHRGSCCPPHRAAPCGSMVMPWRRYRALRATRNRERRARARHAGRGRSIDRDPFALRALPDADHGGAPGLGEARRAARRALNQFSHKPDNNITECILEGYPFGGAHVLM